MSHEPRAWLAKVRLRVLAALLGLVLAALGTISLTTLPAWPIVGVALAGVVFVVNTIGSRLAQDVCFGCGQDISAQSPGAHGVACGSCGAINDSARDSAPADHDHLA